MANNNKCEAESYILYRKKEREREIDLKKSVGAYM